MKIFTIIACITLVFGTTLYGTAGTTSNQTPTVSSEIVEHGGGCRKSSPAGQCCHMDNSAGSVHCH
jgi:hypothetical protein